MAISWEFSRQSRIGVTLGIRDQLVSVDRNVLCLRNPWVADSIFMGKMYIASIVFLVILICALEIINYDGNLWIFCISLIGPCFISFLAWYRISSIKRLSNFYFNRKTRKVYYQRNKTLIAFDWAQTEGGVFARTEFGGRSFSTSYALAFGPRPAPGEEKDRIVLWVDSNQPSDPDPRYIAQVWEYIRQFMEEGPDKLPAPGEPN